MPLSSSRVTVTTTATSIAVGASVGNGSSFTISNPSGGQTVDLGTSSVTSGTGFRLVSGSAISMDLEPGEHLFGIVAATTQVVDVLESGI